MYFFYFVSFFLIGVAFRSFIIGWVQVIVAVVIVLFLFFLFLCFEKVSKPYLAVCLSSMALVVGIVRYDIQEYVAASHVLDAFIGEQIIVEGIISEEPEVRDKNTRLTVDVNFVGQVPDSLAPAYTRLIFSASRYSSYLYGDKVRISGILEVPEKIIEDDGGVFDYPSYLSAKGIFYQFKKADIRILSSGHGNKIKEKLLTIKRIFLEKISATFPEPHSALVAGVLLGVKQSLGEDLQNDFRRAGLMHIVVLSGYNITIVAESMLRLLSFLRPAMRIGAGIGGIVLFAILTGASATIIRASLMAALVLFAKLVRRDYQVARALFLVAFLMVFWNPKSLAFDPSFQLSFLSTLGLMYVSPFFEKPFSSITERFKLRETISSTVSTQIFVLPYIMYSMGEVSIVSLVVNVLVLVFIPATMLFSFMASCIGFLADFLSLPFTFVSYLLLSYELTMVSLFSHLPFASFQVSTFPLWVVYAWYVLYVGIFYLHKTKQPIVRSAVVRLQKMMVSVKRS